MISKHTTQLLAGHTAGHYTLPDTLVALHRAHTTLAAAFAGEPADPGPLEDRYAGEVFTAAINGNPLPPADPLLAARAAAAGWEIQRLALHQAQQQVETELHTATSDDSIIGEHLAPALTAVEEQARVAADSVPVTTTDRTAHNLPPAARKSWQALTDAAHRYTAIRAAQAAVYGPRDADSADDGEWAIFDDLLKAHPMWRGRFFNPTIGNPWPTDVRQFLAWCAQGGHRLVVLPMDERAQRWQTAYGDDLARRQRMHDAALAAGGHDFPTGYGSPTASPTTTALSRGA